jgi:hypothetical protein
LFVLLFAVLFFNVQDSEQDSTQDYLVQLLAIVLRKSLNRHKLTLLRKAAGRRAPRGFAAIPLYAEFQNFSSLHGG